MIHRKSYTNLPNQVLTDKNLTQKDKLVYWAIAYHAWGAKDTCFPSAASIHDLTRVSEGHIAEHTKKLEAMGYLKVIRRGGKKPNMYKLLPLDKLQAVTSSVGDDSQLRVDDSRFPEDDSQSQKARSEEPTVNTTGKREPLSEELQLSITSNKEPEEISKGGQDSSGTYSLQESEPTGVVSSHIDSDDGGATPPAKDDMFIRQFKVSEVQEMLRRDNRVYRAFQQVILEAFKEKYRQTQGSAFVLVRAEVANAEKQAGLLVDKYLEYLGTHNKGKITLDWLDEQVEAFIEYAFEHKNLWVYKANTAPALGLLLYNFGTIINNYARGKATGDVDLDLSARRWAELQALNAKQKGDVDKQS